MSEGDITESKSFLRTFVKKIVVEKEQVIVHYYLPVPAGRNEAKITEVLPMVTPSGAEGTRTPDFLRAREALSQLSYSPVVK